MPATPSTDRAIRTTQVGMLVSAVLAGIKLTAGLLGNTYALVADAVESTLDIFTALVVWGGLHIATLPPDENHPYGHGKAESLAGAVVAVVLMAAAVGIAIEAIQEIRTPHAMPAAWTLWVLVGVVITKWIFSRRLHSVGADAGSHAVKADAWHHLSDAVTSAAAFVGISVALWGGPGWESADDWAALVASGVIAYNGLHLLRPAINDLMDRSPGAELLGPVERAARSVDGVLDVEKLAVRKAGLVYYVDIHVQADGGTTLEAAHVLSGRVKAAIRTAVPQVAGVLVHMEPYEGAGVGRGDGGARLSAIGARREH